MEQKDDMGILDRLEPAEMAGVLRHLMRRHPELRAEAADIARTILEDVDIAEVAGAVEHALTSLDAYDLSQRTGGHRYGYSEPTQAAWELLGEAVEQFRKQMHRLHEAEFADAAEKYCAGILAGLVRARDYKGDGVLAWASDFPEEEDSDCMSRFMGLYPLEQSRAAQQRVIKMVQDLFPEYDNYSGAASDELAGLLAEARAAKRNRDG
ncbi:MAG: hypothetical protein ACLFOY_08015 [Desulfatibacillaceae bacterium]